ncbi:MAG: AAA family ATPase [Chloroflexota bacterium]|nr:AAA family ATPase [Chloroflexota bacterium]
MIERIKLSNYKSLVDIDVKLGDLNVLIGENGSGKSNFLSFLQMLKNGADGSLTTRINEMGGFAETIFYGASSRSSLEWELAFFDFYYNQLQKTRQTVYYSGSLVGRGQSYFQVQNEELERDPNPNHSERFKFLSYNTGRIRLLYSVSGEESRDVDVTLKEQELVLSQITDPVRYPVMGSIRAQMSDWSIFRSFGFEALANIRKAQLFSATEPLRLEPDGSNLVSILQQLANTPKYEKQYERLLQVLSVVFDDFKRLDIPVTAGGMGALYYRSKIKPFENRQIPALSMSDGQLRFLGLVILLLLPDPPPLIAIDEPEIGLHPKMMAILVELLKEASERTQVIVTTHSPELLNDLTLENIILVEKENGITTLKRPNTAHLEKWLERYSLGRLWTFGKLEASARS